MTYKDIGNINNPADVKQAEDRLRKRLEKLGYTLSRGKTVTKDGRRSLKRGSEPHGYRITNASTGGIELGAGFTATIQRVNEFWQREFLRRTAERRRDKWRKM